MKIHSACRYVHAFADVIESWLGEGKINGTIQRVDINTYKAASKLSGQSARNTFAAKFSLPISLAVLLKTGTLKYGTVTEAVIADQAVTELAKKIMVTENPAYTALLPQTRKSDITITFDDGRTLSATLSGARGDFDNPLSKAELLNKYTRMTAHLGNDASDNLKEWALNLKTSADIYEGICTF
jgi:2-methylcitrate dehydratase PrpD